MINLTHTFVAPKGFVNPTIKNYTRKIEIVNLTPKRKIEVPVRIIKNEISWIQYIFLFLIFNQI